MERSTVLASLKDVLRRGHLAFLLALSLFYLRAQETVQAGVGVEEPELGAAPGASLSDEVEACQGSGCGHNHSIGGQAVLEGVMMRGALSWGIAVRQPSGFIARHSFLLKTLGQRYPLLKLPVIRGIIALGESMSLGVRALGISANLSTAGLAGAGGSTEDCDAKQPQLGWRELGISIAIALVVAVVLFVVIPLAVVKTFEETFANPFVFNLVEGLIRVAIFIAYIVAISRVPDLRRVFQYHGAEHKVIHAYEAGERLEPSNVNGRYSTLHPRCGTAFLLVVMLLAVLVFAAVGKPALFWLVVSRIVGIPLIAGVSYEIIKYAGRHKDGLVARVALYPGLLLQRLTTREPSDAQVQVAIEALQEVVRVDTGGEPMPCALAGTAVR
jgi:uncharacterized protein YqhQ